MTTEPTTEGMSAPTADAKIEELETRLATQERMIDAILTESEDVHALRARNAQLESVLGRILGSPPGRALRAGRRKAKEILGSS